MADLGEGPGGPAPPPLFWVKREEMTEVKKASRASKSRPPPPPLFWVKKEEMTEEKKASRARKSRPPFPPQLKVWIRHFNESQAILFLGALFLLDDPIVG